jgi:hypothetical protein
MLSDGHKTITFLRTLVSEKKMIFYKSIVQGRLLFGTQKSYDKVVKMFE